MVGIHFYRGAAIWSFTSVIDDFGNELELLSTYGCDALFYASCFVDSDQDI